MALTDYAENKLLEHILAKTTYTKPTNVYLALFTAAPSDTAAGTEVSGGAYARQLVATNTAAAGSTANTSTLTFPTATAAWGTINAVGIFDALTTGNLLLWTDLATVKTVATGDQLTVAAGALTFALD